MQTKFKVGDIVFIISDKNKHKIQDTYVITKMDKELFTVVKAKKGRTAGKRYLVKPENIYKALPNTKMRNEIQNKYSGEESEKEKLKTKKKLQRTLEETDEECFFCRKAGYLDFSHTKLKCSRYLETVPPIGNKSQEIHKEFISERIRNVEIEGLFF